MRSRPVAALLLVIVLSAGCLGGTPDPGETPDPPAQPVQVQADARTTPHPLFGWPTLSDPYRADGSLVNPWLRPIEPHPLPATITRLDPIAATGLASGAGIALYGHVAIVPGHGDDTHLFDISDPAEPRLLSTLGDAATVTARDVDVIIHPDGRITAVFATNEGVVPVWDLTDPTAPQHLADIFPTAGSHNVAVVPGTPLLYNANSAGGGGLVPLLGLPEGRLPGTGTGITEIYDLSDPAEPVLVQDWANGFGCHDITFYLNPEEGRYRAYCAGIQYTQIWDIADPTRPQVLTNIPVHYGLAEGPSAEVFLVNFAHLAMVSPDAQVLIVGDETGGGLAMACDAYIDQGPQTISGPFGNLWFYDLSDEADPKLMSWFSPPPSYITNPPRPDDAPVFGWSGCTAHFGRNIDDRHMLVMAFYGAGTLLVDYSDLRRPVIVDQWNQGTNTWDAWYHQGYVFTGDLKRGLDVFALQ